MNSELELLALRKDVLVARASLQRLRMARDAAALRHSLRGSRALVGLAGSGAARAALFGLLLLVAGRSRFARWMSIAGAALALARVARAFRNEPPVDCDQPGGAGAA